MCRRDWSSMSRRACVHAPVPEHAGRVLERSSWGEVSRQWLRAPGVWCQGDRAEPGPQQAAS